MTTSNAGIAMIKKYEGYRNKAYLDPAGVWTIGYGHTNGVISGMTCTEEQATKWLMEDLRKSELNVSGIERWGYKLNQSQFDALVSFTFNCGARNLSRLCDSGKRTIREIGEKILLYNKANGKVLEGLVKRRKEESDMILNSIIEDKPSVTMEPASVTKYGVKSNYYIREQPSVSGLVIGNTNNITIKNVLGKCDGWILTEYGWISDSAFYDKF